LALTWAISDATYSDMDSSSSRRGVMDRREIAGA
jgi:hypothetical protein